MTNDAAKAARMRALRDHAQPTRYVHTEIGFNYRMDGLQGAVLRIKLNHLPDWTARPGRPRRAVRPTAGRPAARPPGDGPDRSHVWHLFVVLHPERDRLRAALADRNIQTGLHYPTPVHLQQAYAHLGHQPGDFPVTERIARECLSLPLFPEMTDEQQDAVVGGPGGLPCRSEPADQRRRLDPNFDEYSPQIDYLGHAGFRRRTRGDAGPDRPVVLPGVPGVLVPVSRTTGSLLAPLAGERFDYLYISHTHEDHFDERVPEELNRQECHGSLPRRTGRRRSQKRIRALGFTQHRSAGSQAVAWNWPPDSVATVLLDTGHKEDSGLLLDMDGFRFLDLNDCNTPLSELPDRHRPARGAVLRGDVVSELLRLPAGRDAARRSPAVRDDLIKTLVQASAARTRGQGLSPLCRSAVFLDPALAQSTTTATRRSFRSGTTSRTRFGQACPRLPV